MKRTQKNERSTFKCTECDNNCELSFANGFIPNFVDFNFYFGCVRFDLHQFNKHGNWHLISTEFTEKKLRDAMEPDDPQLDATIQIVNNSKKLKKK